MIIRPETKRDIATIHSLTAAAFEPMLYSNGSEPHIIDGLRKAGDLTISLVAEEEGVILGQVTFSPVTINGVHGGCFGLGPVAVLPSRQGEGIGAKLIKEGLERLKEIGAASCVLIGNPNYYGRFGFRNKTGLNYHGLDNQFVQQLPFNGAMLSGDLKYANAFEKSAAS